MGAVGAPGLLSSARPSTAAGVPPFAYAHSPGRGSGAAQQDAGSAAASAASAAAGSSPPPALSGAGGGLVGALASRLCALEAEAQALRGELAAREREAASRGKEVTALRRQLEGALGEARSAREALGSRERVLVVSGSSRGDSGGAGAGAAAQALSPQQPSSGVSPRTSAALKPAPPSLSPTATASTAAAAAAAAAASPVTAGELQFHREASARAEAASLREELASVLKDREALEGKTRALQRQVRDMSRFLNDYGLEWVGHDVGGGDGAAVGGLGGSSSSASSENGSARGAGGAQEGLPQPPIDFALLLFRLQQLNALAGEGKSRIVSKDGAHQLVTEPLGGRLSLTLFRDGLMLRRGPFRPYDREATRIFVQDVLDGYFPFELKDQCVAIFFMLSSLPPPPAHPHPPHTTHLHPCPPQLPRWRCV